MLKSTLLSSMGSFVLGGSVALASLMAYTGTTDLQAIKDSVASYVAFSEDQLFELTEKYNVTVDEANAEIDEWQQALNQANDNIYQLATAYEQQQAKYEADIADLQAEYDEMVARLEQQYEADINAVIEQANAEIQKANEEVAQTKEEVQQIIDGSNIGSIQDTKELDTGGDKTVTEVEIIAPEEQATEGE